MNVFTNTHIVMFQFLGSKNKFCAAKLCVSAIDAKLFSVNLTNNSQN